MRYRPAPPMTVPQPLANDASVDAPSNEPPASMWTLVREAMAGVPRDYTREALGRAVILLAIPMVAEMIMESIFAVADIFWVSKLGADAVTAVGLTESLLTIVYALAMGLSMGASAVVARRTGEKDEAGATRAATQSLFMALALAAVVGIVGGLLAPRLLSVMGGTHGVVAVGSDYARIMLGGSVVVFMLFVVNAVFRGVGDPAIAMRTLILANTINIVLGPFLVFGWGPFPRLGVTGAAVATTIGRGIGVLYQFAALASGRGRIRLERRYFRLEFDLIRTIARVAQSGVVQSLVGMASWIWLVRIVASFGSDAVAGYTIAFRVIMFALLPAWGMSNAAATLVGQNLGAGQPDRAERAVWRAALYNLVFLGGVGLAFVLLAEPIVGLFHPTTAVLAFGTRCLRVVSAGFLFYAYGMVVTAAFNGAGDTRTPTLLNFACFWVWEIPLAYVLAHYAGMGPTGVFVSITAAFSLFAVVGVVMFRRGAWKRVKV